MDPFLLAFLGGLSSWLATALGASIVFCSGWSIFKSTKTMEFLYGVCSGIMLSASFFSLIAPAIKFSEDNKIKPLIPVLIGFSLGIGFIKLIEFIIPERCSSCIEIQNQAQYVDEDSNDHIELEEIENEDNPTNYSASIPQMRHVPKNLFILVIAVTLHNIPEGFVIGFGYGASSKDINYKLSDAILLTLAIALQNIPEGLALSIPLHKSGMSRFKSFFIAQASGIVEIIAALIGVSFVVAIKSLLPYALSFAAGAMVYVVFTDLLPLSYKESEKWGKRGSIVGFAIIMALDVGFG